jgi:hypothetical protein
MCYSIGVNSVNKLNPFCFRITKLNVNEQVIKGTNLRNYLYHNTQAGLIKYC